MQQYLGSIHHSAIINNDQLANLLEEAVMMRDLPGMADVDSSLLWFCEQMKQDYTVALSGECADEIFGGYPWFYKEELLNGNGVSVDTVPRGKTAAVASTLAKETRFGRVCEGTL